MPFDINDFHFLRPLFLLLLIPAIFLIYQLSHNAKNQSAWKNVISPHLLEFLFISGEKQKSRSTFLLTGIAVSLIILAISGPTFRQKSVPVFQTEHAQIILLDLSLSMDATDVKPSRLERAKFKLIDLLKETREGTVALVIYAGDAFTISPLTSDANTIAAMVPTLSSRIMPVLGSRPDIAIDKSIELLQNAKHSQGEIIWLTDGVEEHFVEPIISSLKNSAYQLSILAVGTEQGAPIPLPEGNGFLKDSNGAIVVPKLELSQLTEIANQVSAGFIQLTADSSDIDYLRQHQQWKSQENEVDENNEQMINRWIDDGYWIIWLSIAIFLAKIIKQPSGRLMNLLAPLVIFLTIFIVPTRQVSALEWKDLWYTKNQQAKQAFEQGNFDQAANLYQSKQWQATSQFRNGEFSQAADNFMADESTSSLYNHATSLAKSEQLQPALDAYNKLLESEPDHADALHNKKIIEDLLKQQQQQNQDQENQQDQQDQSEQENQDQQSEDSESDSQEQKDGEENSEQEQQQEQQQESEQEESEAQQKEMEMSEDERDKSEKDQALEHWLEKIPDDPGGLLRRKMYREYQRRGREQKEKKLW